MPGSIPPSSYLLLASAPGGTYVVSSGGLTFQGAASTVREPITEYSASGTLTFLGTATTSVIPAGAGEVFPYTGAGLYVLAGAGITSPAGPGPVSSYGPTPGGYQFRGAADAFLQLTGVFPYVASGRYLFLGDAATQRKVSAWRLVLAWDVEAQTGVDFPRLVLSWEVLETRLEDRQLFQWVVQPGMPGLILEWDIIPSELPAGVYGQFQVLEPVARREDGSTLPMLGFTVDADLGLPADQYTVRVQGSQEVVEATVLDAVSIATGLAVNGNVHRVPLIADGGGDEYSLAEDVNGWQGTLKGRNAMARLLDCTVAIRFVLPSVQPPLEETEPMETRLGQWWASQVAAVIAEKVGLGLAWRCRDYPLQEDFQAVGRPLDIIQELVQPWSQFAPLQVDVYVRGYVIVAQARDLAMVADPVNIYPVTGGRVQGLSLALQPLPAITRVVVEGARGAPAVIIPVDSVAAWDAAVAAGADPSVALMGSPKDWADMAKAVADDADPAAPQDPEDPNSSPQGPPLAPGDDLSGGVGGTPVGDGGAAFTGSLYGPDAVTVGDCVFPDGTRVPAGTSVNTCLQMAQAKGVQVIGLEGPDGAVRYAGTQQTTSATADVHSNPIEPYLAETQSWSASNTPTEGEAKAGAVRGPVIGYSDERVTYRMPDQIVLAVVKRTYQGLMGSDIKLVSIEAQFKQWEPSKYGPTGPVNQPLQLGERIRKEGYVPSSGRDQPGVEKSPLDWGVIEDTQTSYIYDTQRMLRAEVHVAKKIKATSPSEAREEAGGDGAAPAEYDYFATFKTYRTEGKLWVKIETDSMRWEKETFLWVVVQRDSQVQAGYRAGGMLAADVAENQRPAQDEAAMSEAVNIANRDLALPGHDPSKDKSTGAARAQKKAPKDGKGRIVNGRVRAEKTIRTLDLAGPKVPRYQSVKVSNAHLGMDDAEYIISQAERASGPSFGPEGEVQPGLWEHDLAATLVGVPWLLPGMVVQFTEWTNSDGDTQDLPPALLYHVTHTYQEGRGQASHTAMVRAVFWQPTPADLAAAGVVRRQARRPLGLAAILPRLVGRGVPYALTAGGSYHSPGGPAGGPVGSYHGSGRGRQRHPVPG